MKAFLGLSLIFALEIIQQSTALTFYPRGSRSRVPRRPTGEGTLQSRDKKNIMDAGSLERILALKGGYDSTIGPDPSNPIQFFTLAGGMCPYAARTLIVFHELGLPFETVEISGKPDWYLQINPRGKVPAIRVPADNNEVIYESSICDEYLCDMYNNMNQDSTSTLMPNDPIQRARIRLLNDQIDTVLSPAFFTYFMNNNDTKDEEMLQKLENALNFFENALKTYGGPYFNGLEFTLADVHLLPFFLRMVVTLRHYKKYTLSEEKYPRLLKWFELCSERNSVKVASKPDQVIIETYKKFKDMNYKFGGLNKN
mmetsp:Transcript_19850/g.24489  ORF Transcript_19850/g.24489 Transcript_19850/m.24489 type:complete len:312 (+) Transcript_19850:99-1034(+)